MNKNWEFHSEIVGTRPVSYFTWPEDVSNRYTYFFLEKSTSGIKSLKCQVTVEIIQRIIIIINITKMLVLNYLIGKYSNVIFCK